MRVLLLVLLASTLSCRLTGGPPEERSPNILYVLADDLGYGELGSYGQRKIRTPNLDRLGGEGMRFTQHYSGSPVCAPSRCVLLTGRHTGRSIVRANWERGGWGPDEPEGQFPLPEGTPTLARILQERGYATACVGKWGLGGPETSGHPNRQGFDFYYGYLCQRVAHNYYPTHLWKNESRDALAGNEHFPAHQKLAAPLASEEEYWERYTAPVYAPDRMIEEALAFVRRSKEQPFFLYFASPVPHAAIQVPPSELAAYPADWDREHYLGQKGYLPHPSPRRGYAAMVSRFDTDVGRLLALLDELDLSDDTIVLFSSDNGPTYNGGTDSTFFDSAGGLRGLKGSVWEGGLRVPFLVRWPGRVPAGTTSDLVSGFQDMLPTLLELSGFEGGLPPVDGISIAATLLGRGEQTERSPMYWEYLGQQALRMGDWKAVRTGLRKGDTTIALFDLASDPGEQNDLAALRPEVVERLRTRMSREHVPSQDFPLSAIDPSAE